MTVPLEKANELLDRSRRISELIDRLVQLHERVDDLREELARGRLDGVPSIRAGMGAELEEIDAAIRAGGETRAEELLAAYHAAGGSRAPLIERLVGVKKADNLPTGRTATALKDIEDNIVHRNYMAADAALTELEVSTAPSVTPAPLIMETSPPAIAPVVEQEVTCPVCGIKAHKDLCPSCGHDPRSPTDDCAQCGRQLMTTFGHCPFCGRASSRKEAAGTTVI